jgi:GntR family negative regulator for fad regulon and positive regulator of fabA
MLPSVAGRAAGYQPEILLDCLAEARNLAEDAKAFSDFDWKLQMLMARNSQNPVFSLILNDFARIFANMGLHYFNLTTARQASRTFYRALTRAIEKRSDTVEEVVKKAMEQSISIWQEVKPGLSGSRFTIPDLHRG